MALITDFLPYFYIPCPKGLQEDDFNAFKEYLNVSTYISFWFRSLLT